MSLSDFFFWHCIITYAFGFLSWMAILVVSEAKQEDAVLGMALWIGSPVIVPAVMGYGVWRLVKEK